MKYVNRYHLIHMDIRIEATDFKPKTANLKKNFVWLKITDAASVPEMRIWSELLIRSDL